MKKMFAVLVVVTGLFAIPAKAQGPITGADLLTDCRAWERIHAFEAAAGDTSHFSQGEWVQNGYCSGFVMGVANAELGTSFIVDGVVSTVSTPSGFTGKQVVKVFIAYAETHPEALKLGAEDAVISALGTAGILVKKDVGILAPLGSTPKQSTPKSSTQPEHDKA